MTTPTAPRRPPGRYDEPRPPVARPWRIAGTSLAVLSVVVLGYFLFLRPNSGVTGTTTSYQVVGDTSVHVEIQVHAPADRTVYCTVRGRSLDNVDVGSATVRIDIGESGTATVGEDVPTTARANTGELVGCAFNAQDSSRDR